MSSSGLSLPRPLPKQGIAWRFLAGLREATTSQLSIGLAWLWSHVELFALLAISGALTLYTLSLNGYANTYYTAAVRSMSANWHNFLFASFDAQGTMSVDKPPLALWLQTLSVKQFGFNSWSYLVPQALLGMASVALVYGLTRRYWGRVGGSVAGLALAL